MNKACRPKEQSSGCREVGTSLAALSHCGGLQANGGKAQETRADERRPLSVVLGDRFGFGNPKAIAPPRPPQINTHTHYKVNLTCYADS